MSSRIEEAAAAPSSSQQQSSSSRINPMEPEAEHSDSEDRHLDPSLYELPPFPKGLSLSPCLKDCLPLFFSLSGHWVLSGCTHTRGPAPPSSCPFGISLILCRITINSVSLIRPRKTSRRERESSSKAGTISLSCRENVTCHGPVASCFSSQRAR